MSDIGFCSMVKLLPQGEREANGNNYISMELLHGCTRVMFDMIFVDILASTHIKERSNGP